LNIKILKLADYGQLYLKTAIIGTWEVLEFCPLSSLWTL